MAYAVEIHWYETYLFLIMVRLENETRISHLASIYSNLPLSLKYLL